MVYVLMLIAFIGSYAAGASVTSIISSRTYEYNLDGWEYPLLVVSATSAASAIAAAFVLL